MIDVAKLFSEPQRNWEKKSGATSEEIAHLMEEIKRELPEEILELLRFSNGGSGDLAHPPRLLILYSCAEILEEYHDEWLKEAFSDFLFIGSNGGIESIAIDYREKKPYPIVMIDRIAGPKSAKMISPDSESFIVAIGLRYNKVNPSIVS